MTMNGPGPSSLSAEGALTLAVAWRKGIHVVGGQVDVTDEVADHLRAAALGALDALGDREAKPYTADADLAAEEFLVVPEAAVESSGEVLSILRGAAELPVLEASELPSRPLLLYGVVIGDTPSQRVAFVRNTNPVLVAKQGRYLTALREALTTVDEPIFAFDDKIDLIIAPGGVLVLSLTAFERVFRDAEVIREQIPDWVADVATHLPMSADTMKILTERCERDGRLRRRLLAIRERGHLAEVTIADLRREAKIQGIDPKSILKGGELVLDKIDVPTMLKLLNEDLMVGGLSKTRFAVDRKSPR